MFHRGLVFTLLLSLILLLPRQSDEYQVAGANPPPLENGANLATNTYYNPYPITRCSGIGTEEALASDHGIRFTANKNFFGIELRMINYDGGISSFTAELRRSSGFTGEPDYTVNAEQNFPWNWLLEAPFEPVFLDFGTIGVIGTETFTLKFTNISDNDWNELYFESFGTESTGYCPNVSVTNENDVAAPTVRGDPAGFKVVADGSSRPSIRSIYQTVPPAIDGVIGPGEWPTRRIDFSNGYLSVVNDDKRLYLLFNLLDATDEGANDSLQLTFDVDRDGSYSPGVDRQYISSSGGNLRYRTYTHPDGQTGDYLPVPYSARARGFGCFQADGTLNPTEDGTYYCNKHRVWEFAIDLSEIEAEDFYSKVTTRLGFYGFVENPDTDFELPSPRRDDLLYLIDIYFDIGPGYEYTSDPAATLSLPPDAVEITQVIQDRQNNLPLAGHKDTVARVYVDVSNTTYFQPVRVYLFGRKNGQDLPGSPLLKHLHAPLNVDRELLYHTANFLLPESWRGVGTVTFWSKILDYEGGTDESTPFDIEFHQQDTPTYWVVPINTWTAANPTLVSEEEILRQQEAMTRVFPVSGINFIRKGWREVGVTDVEDTIDELNQYYNNTAEAWARGIRDSGSAPFVMPEQIYGFTPEGGGISDPTWLGDEGRVARGFRGSSREFTMAHEIDHNLDRSTDGTWGRHVAGCGASGPDPEWPYGNDDIQEVGFDTHEPWVDNSARDSVIPANFPDFMSYCQSDDLSGIAAGHLPTKWISPYRWESLFNYFNGAPADSFLDSSSAIGELFYISGVIHDNGTGELDPIHIGPGIPTADLAPGDYSIEILDSSDGLISATTFLTSFIDSEGNSRTDDRFYFQLHAPSGAVKVQLKHDTLILDSIEASPNPPTVTITAPNGGEDWSGVKTISWTAGDTDLNDLVFHIQYTPDDGKSWFPVATNLNSHSFDVDLANLPGGEQARILVIASDGFNTVEDTSDGTFATGDNPPAVTITSPIHGDVLSGSDPILLTGRATDLEDGPLADENLLWVVDGEHLGVGSSLLLWLSPGFHMITLQAQDSQGNVNQDAINFHVGSSVYLPLLMK